MGRHLLIGHAQIVDVYRKSFKPAQDGQIGIALGIHWHVPYDDSPESEQVCDLLAAWFLTAADRHSSYEGGNGFRSGFVNPHACGVFTKFFHPYFRMVCCMSSTLFFSLCWGNVSVNAKICMLFRT